MSTRTWLLLVLLLVGGTVGFRPLSLALLPSGAVYATDGAPTYGFEFGEAWQPISRFSGSCFISPIPLGAVVEVDTRKKIKVAGEEYAPLVGSRFIFVRLSDTKTKP